jgi:predicted cation transporter
MMSIPNHPVPTVTIGLAAVALSLLILPFLSRKIEDNLEPFFLAAGVAAMTVSGLWSWPVVLNALKAPVTIGSLPIGIFQIVLVMGLLIHFFNAPFSFLILYAFLTRIPMEERRTRCHGPRKI